jgi:hypothetical protein
MDVHKRLALSKFYREEFLRHIEHLQAAGILDESHQEVVEKARVAFTTRLDQLCALQSFPALAERMLRRFDTLSGLSALDSRQRH